jgi:hypothetical protein
MALGLYLAPRLSHLRDIQDYRYVDVDIHWVWGVTLIPCVVLVILLPVLLSKNIFYRWFSFGLCLFPGFLAFFEFIQFPWL